MAEAIGLLAGTAQLLVSVADLITLALDLRDELLKGPRRIRDHIRCLDSTISILEAVDRDNLKPTDTIHGFLCAVDQSVKALQRILQKQLRHFTKGSFRKLLGALNTIKSEDKINGAFSALEREKTNLHLHIAFKVDRKLDLLIPSNDMSTDAKCKERETSESQDEKSVPVRANDMLLNESNNGHALARRETPTAAAGAEETSLFPSTPVTADIPAGNYTADEPEIVKRRRTGSSNISGTTAASGNGSQSSPEASAKHSPAEPQASAGSSPPVEYKLAAGISFVSNSTYRGKTEDRIGHEVDSDSHLPDLGLISLNLNDTYDKDTKRSIGNKFTLRQPGSNNPRPGEY